MNIIPFPSKHAPGIIAHLSPAMARAFRALERKGLNTETARTLADVPAESPKDFCLKLSLLAAGLEIMKGTDWDQTIEEVWARAFQGKPLPDDFPALLGVTTAFFGWCLIIMTSSLTCAPWLNPWTGILSALATN